jgi:hypothetical protein
MESWFHLGILNDPPSLQFSTCVSPFKYVIVLALSIWKNSPYLNKKVKKKKKSQKKKIIKKKCQVIYKGKPVRIIADILEETL